MTANLLLICSVTGTELPFLGPPALANSEHHRGNAVLFALAPMPMCLPLRRPALFT